MRSTHFLLACCLVLVACRTAAAQNCATQNGDLNADGSRDLSDAVFLLSWNFLGGPAPSAFCEPAGAAEAGCAVENGDANGDRGRDLSDAVYLLSWNFLGGPAPVPICRATSGEGLTDTRISGRFALPPGSALTAQELRVWTAFGSDTPAANGSFELPGLGPGAQLVAVLNEDGDPALLAFVEESPSVVDSHSTAVALLYHTVGAWLQTADWQAEALRELRRAPETEELAEVIRTALEGGARSIAGARETIAPAVVEARRSLLEPRRGRGAAAPFITPPGTRSGVSVDEQSIGAIEIVNRFRRRALAFVRKASYVRDDGTPAGVLVETPGDVARRIDLSPTAGATSVLGTLWHVAWGGGLHTPVTTPPIRVPIEPDDALATNYEVFVAGLGMSEGDWDRLSEPLKTEVRFLWIQSIVFDLALPAILNVVLPAATARVEQLDLNELANQLASIRTLLNAVGSVTPQVSEAVVDGRLADAAFLVFDLVLGDARVQAALVEAAQAIVESLVREGSLAEAALGNLQRVFVALTVADFALTATDSVFQVLHFSRSNLADRWEVRSSRGEVSLDPPRARTDRFTTTDFTARIRNEDNSPGASFRYVWESRNALGKLSVADEAPAFVLETNSDSVTYTPEPGSDGLDEVRVTVFLVDSNRDVQFGQANASVEITDREVILAPPRISVCQGESQVVDALLNPVWDRQDPLYYRWNVTTAHGSLDFGVENAVTADAWIEYTASEDAVDGSTETVSVEVFWAPHGTELESLGTATGTITIEERKSVVEGTFQIGIRPIPDSIAACTGGYVAFPRQEGAIGYRAIGEGGFDEAFYGARIDVRPRLFEVVGEEVDWTENSPFTPGAGVGLIPLSGGCGVDEEGTFLAWLEERFANFRFIVEVSYPRE